jgi:hypothetical protein
MQPVYQEAFSKLEAEQLVVDRKVSSGAYHSKRRDAAISNLIKLAASEEFRKRVSAHACAAGASGSHSTSSTPPLPHPLP